MSEETAADAAVAAPPHVLLVCFPSQGHVNPTLRFAKRLAAKGLLVTCCATSGIGAQLAAASSSGSAAVSTGADDGVSVGSGRLRFEFLDDHGNTKYDLMRYLETSGPAAFAELLGPGRQAGAGRPVACVVGNPFLPWVTDVAEEAGVPSAVLWVQSCAVFSIYYHFAHGLVELPQHEDDDGLEARFTLPGLPPLSVADVPSFLLASHPYKKIGDKMQEQLRNMGKASWVFANSFAELERDVVAALPSVRPRPPQLIPVGPLVELEGPDNDAVVSVLRGDLIKAADDECLGWLDAQAPRSVVYASVGSIVVLSAEEVAEMC